MGNYEDDNQDDDGVEVDEEDVHDYEYYYNDNRCNDGDEENDYDDDQDDYYVNDGDYCDVNDDL